MKTLDLRRQLKHLYAPSSKRVEVVRVPAFKFAMVDGVIQPGEGPSTSKAFQEALTALYGITFTLKFMSKLRATNPIDYPVMALEALWGTGKRAFDFYLARPWHWTAMILQPDHITPAMFKKGIEQLRRKRNNPAIGKLRLEKFKEGLSLQIMHVGPYVDEQRTVELMRNFAGENGYIFQGRHHEIYLGDPRRARPEKLRTVLRHAVAKTARR